MTSQNSQITKRRLRLQFLHSATDGHPTEPVVVVYCPDKHDELAKALLGESTRFRPGDTESADATVDRRSFQESDGYVCQDCSNYRGVSFTYLRCAYGKNLPGGAE